MQKQKELAEPTMTWDEWQVYEKAHPHPKGLKMTKKQYDLLSALGVFAHKLSGGAKPLARQAVNYLKNAGENSVVSQAPLTTLQKKVY